jgi:putative ABC transport system ATP-binding protein
MLSAVDLQLAYGVDVALAGVSLDLPPGSRVALMGPSGSGKSSLLHCLCGVVRPDAGKVLFDDTDLTGLSEAKRSRLRLKHFGVVFQRGDLVPELTLTENVALPLMLLGVRRAEAERRATEQLSDLGVGNVASLRAGAVSGGQAQRAAVARAVVHRPAVILADEPTGSLDTVNGERVMDALVGVTQSIDAALFVVTHDHRVAAQLDQTVLLRDGAVVEGARERL